MSTEQHNVTAFCVSSAGEVTCRHCGERVVTVHASELEPVPGRMGCTRCDFTTTVDAGGLALLADHLSNGHPKWRLRR